MKSEKDDFFFAKGFSLIAFLVLWSGFAAMLARVLVNPSCWWGVALFGVGVGLLTGSFIRIRYSVFGFIGNIASLLYAFLVYSNRIARFGDDGYDYVQQLAVISFLVCAANIPLFWKLYQLNRVREIIARSKLSRDSQNPR